MQAEDVRGDESEVGVVPNLDRRTSSVSVDSIDELCAGVDTPSYHAMDPTATV